MKTEPSNRSFETLDGGLDAYASELLRLATKPTREFEEAIQRLTAKPVLSVVPGEPHTRR